jgi:predicted RNA-binding protein with EMAP domain
VTEDFLRENEVLLAFLSVSVFEGVMQSPGATDWDVREALDALVATWRSLQTGIYYETQPANLYAATIARHVQTVIEDVRKKEARERGVSSIRDADILGVLAFLQRLEYTRNNGRKRSRSYIDFLGGFYVPPTEAGAENLTEPDEPLIIL